MSKSLDDIAIECASVNLGDSRQQHVNNKADLVRITEILGKPLIKYKGRYYVFDGNITYANRP
jgi:hypothetical protein